MFGGAHFDSELQKSQKISTLHAVLQLVLQNCRQVRQNYTNLAFCSGIPPVRNRRITHIEVGMAHEENKAFLRRVPLFTGLTESQLEILASGTVRRNYPKGRTIVAEGEPSQSLYILLSGRAKVQRSDSEGKEVILAVLMSGEFFGEMSLIDDAPRSASVITLESCDFLAINKENFKAMLTQNADLGMAVMRGLVRRLREADKKIETLALLDVYGRVARVLLDFSENVGGERIVKAKLPRQEIAKMIGASREMVSRVMKGLEIDGYIVSLPEGKLALREKIHSYIG
jgi:CRP/FNR family transcriptional regulator, cyclic AMP receptor protein